MGNRFSAKITTDVYGGQYSPLNKLLREKIPTNVVDKVRGMFLFRPNDPNDLLQSAHVRMKMEGVERIKGYRYPAPGSQPPPHIPIERPELSHSINYYARASKNFRAPKVIVRPARYADSPLNPDGKIATKIVMPGPGLLPDPAAPKDPSRYIVDPGLTSSPGNKNPAVMRYDPTGLSSSMTASWPEMYKSLSANAAADHLPVPAWKTIQSNIVAEYEKKGLPPPPGQRWLLDKDLPPMAKESIW